MADEIPRTGRIPRRGVTARRRYPLSARKAVTNSRIVVPATPSQLERALNRQESVPSPETHVDEGTDENVFVGSEESGMRITIGRRTEESPIVLLRHMSRVSVKAQERLQTPRKQILSPASQRFNFRTPGSATTTPTSARRILKFTPGIIASLTKKPSVKSVEHRVRHGRVTKETPINILRRLTRAAGLMEGDKASDWPRHDLSKDTEDNGPSDLMEHTKDDRTSDLPKHTEDYGPSDLTKHTEDDGASDSTEYTEDDKYKCLDDAGMIDMEDLDDNKEVENKLDSLSAAGLTEGDRASDAQDDKYKCVDDAGAIDFMEEFDDNKAVENKLISLSAACLMEGDQASDWPRHDLPKHTEDGKPSDLMEHMEGDRASDLPKHMEDYGLSGLIEHTEDDRASDLPKHMEDYGLSGLIEHTKDDRASDLPRHMENYGLSDLIEHTEDDRASDLPKHMENYGLSDLIEHTKDDRASDLPKYTEDYGLSDLIEHMEDDGASDLPKHTEDYGPSDLMDHTEDDRASDVQDDKYKCVDDAGATDFVDEFDDNEEAENKQRSTKSKAARNKPPPRLSAHGIPVPSLPKTLIRSLFTRFSHRKVSREAWNSIYEASDKFFEQAADSLVRISDGRRTITEDDVVTLMKRQNVITANRTLESLAHKYLPRELSDEICKTAQTGNALARNLATSAIEKEEQRINGGGKDLKIEITDRAAQQLNIVTAREKEPNNVLRVTVDSGGCHGFQYLYDLTEADKLQQDDVLFEKNGAKVVVDMTSLELINGAKLDYTEELVGSQFKVIDNPRAATACG
ncbi:3868_t:CDS:10 [Paraglomus occultum]|uniref:3868_t:CDS:1 n=1 Tax=Paraglomus occultum TaxID=144539 RepID=A0A9N8VQ46_9GLOM|nr:3868_t:CDS:10 [Paraglomus occultum]